MTSEFVGVSNAFGASIAQGLAYGRPGAEFAISVTRFEVSCAVSSPSAARLDRRDQRKKMLEHFLRGWNSFVTR